MWFLKLIGIIVAFIIVKFVIDLIKQSKEMKNQGGVRTKYAKIVDYVLSSHPDSKIFQQDSTLVVVGVTGIAGSQIFYIQKTFDVVNIQMKVKNNPLCGNVEIEWKFPENMDQGQMISKIELDVKLKLIQSISDFVEPDVSYDKHDECETSHNMEVDGISESWWKEMEEKCGITKEGVEKTLNELNLAPDLSKNNELENKLFAIAQQGVKYIESSFKKLPKDGYAEALIYCSSILVNLGTNHKNKIDLDIFEDRYFLLLHDEVLYHSNVDDIISYINKRVEFYTDQEMKLRSNPHYYTPMFIYNAFYMNPGCDAPDQLSSFSEDPGALMMLQYALEQTRLMMMDKAAELGYQVPDIDDMI